MSTRFFSIALIGAIAISLTGCQSAPPPAAAPGEIAPSAAPGLPPAEPPVTIARPLTGHTDVYGQPMAGATVKAMRLDTGAVVAMGITDDAGRFTLAMPLELTAGLPLKLVANKDGKTLAGLALVPAAPAAARRVLATEEWLLSAATTIAVVALGADLDNAGRAAIAADGQLLSRVVEAMIGAFNQLSKDAQAALATASTDALKQAVLVAVSPEGQAQMSNDALAKLGNSAALSQVLRSTVSVMVATIWPSTYHSSTSGPISNVILRGGANESGASGNFSNSQGPSGDTVLNGSAGDAPGGASTGPQGDVIVSGGSQGGSSGNGDVVLNGQSR